VDETGSNTNQKDDKHAGSQKFVCESGTTSKLAVATSDHCFTLIPIVAMNGDAICCCIIFQGDANSLPVDWCMGRDITIVPEKDENGNIVLG